MIVERDTFDAVVVGAGPAGSVAAMQLARGGARVLLVDKAMFPRDKVCGCCINAAAVALLDGLGVADILTEINAEPVERFRLYTPGRTTTLKLPRGFAASRASFDHALAQRAVDAGATFVDGATANVELDEAGCTVALRRAGDHQRIRCAVVLGCTGLADRSFDHLPGLAPQIDARSLMGCAAIGEGGPAMFEPGIIHMVHGRGGYVGLKTLDRGRLDVAAALSPEFVRLHGGPGNAANALLASANLPSLPVEWAWRGTPLLTRRRASVAARRVFLVGDAAGYVEPFTGEGIAWAIASAQAAAPLALQAIRRWDDSLIDAWNRAHRSLLGSRQRRCRWLTRAMRPPMVTRTINRVLSLAPALARPFIRAINRPWPALAPAELAGARR